MKKLIILTIAAAFIFMSVSMPVHAGDTDFKALYAKDPECFMSLNYEGVEGPAPKYWLMDDPQPARLFVRIDGEEWLAQREMLAIDSHEYLSCFNGKTVGPAWLCGELVPTNEEIAAPAPMPKTFVVYFDFDKANIKTDQIATLKEAMAYAQQGGVADVKFSASCDFRGSDAYNMTLGQKRADAVALWMADHGLDLPIETVNNGKGRSLIRALVNGIFCKDCWSDRKVNITIN
jgi:outer membrane protein OmpA-like peptidoglycan-associated protein